MSHLCRVWVWKLCLWLPSSISRAVLYGLSRLAGEARACCSLSTPVAPGTRCPRSVPSLPPPLPWPGHRQGRRSGEHPTIPRADGAVGGAVPGGGEHDVYRAVGVRPDGDLPPDVLARLQPTRPEKLAPGQPVFVEAQVPDGLQPAQAGRYRSLQLVVLQVEEFQVAQVPQGCRDVARQVVSKEFQVLEVGQASQLAGMGPVMSL